MAEVKNMGDFTVNDGHGLMDTDGFIDSMIHQCNDAVRMLVSGQYLAFCNNMYSLAQKLVALKTGTKKELDSLRQQLEDALKFNNDLAKELNERND